MDFIIANTHYLSSRGLCSIIAQQVAGARVYEVTSKSDLVRLLSVCPKSVAIVNLSSFDFTDFDSFMRVVERFDGVRWVLTYPDLSGEAIVRGKAEDISIIDLDGTAADFSAAVKDILSDKQHICVHAAETETDRNRAAELTIPLTNSEKEILKLMAAGMSVKEIADIRCNSTHTIITHKKNIFRKLDVNTTHEAVKYALRSGLVDPIDYYI